MKATGRVWKFAQDDINTDQIRRKIYAHLPANEQARHCFEEIDPEFSVKAMAGDILVVGRNFGCGSSTLVHGALMALGIVAIVAESFGRLFFRSAISDGLLVVVCPDIVGAVINGDRIKIDTVRGEVKNLTSGQTLSCKPLNGILNEILESGGEKPYLKARLARERLAT